MATRFRLPLRARTSTVVAIALIATAAGCTTAKTASPPTTGAARPTSTTSATGRPSRPACKTGADAAVVATPVAGVASDRVITSFDDTLIRVHWFPLDPTGEKRAPTIFMGPGWGMAGDTNTATSNALGITSITDLRNAGYNVLTWDPRGFGQSTGTVETDSAAAEGRDVQRVIDWVAAQPGVQLDGANDPRLGMVGASYGGGIQLVTAAIDCRVDAIVPAWAWHSLTTSLYKAGTVKSGWSRLLYSIAASRPLDRHIVSANQSGTATGTLSADDVAWFADRGPGDLVGKIRIPTLFVQGTVDTLFTLDEAIQNYRILRANGVPTAMVWFCGGHGVCLTNAGDRRQVGRETLAWLAYYVKGDTHVPLGARFAFVDQNGTGYTADDYPLPAGAPITADGTGTLQLIATGGSGPAHPEPGNPDLLAGLVAPITPARATNAVDVTVSAAANAAVIVGEPKLTFTYRGTVKAGTRPTRIFAQLVDATTGLVVGNQITPIEVMLDGAEHTATVPLESIAFTLPPGKKLVLQLVATTVAYATPRLGGSIDVAAHISLPVATGLAMK